MQHDFEALGKEIVVGRLAAAEDPYALAGEIVRKIAVAAVVSEKDPQDPRATLTAACRGVASGMLLIEKDLARTAVALLSMMPTIAQEAALDPATCMTWAMEGLAPAVKLAPGGAADAVRMAIEEKFMGAGEAFDAILRASGA